MKTKYLIFSLAIILTLVLTGCNFTFNEFRQEEYVGAGEEFELFMNVSDNNVGAGGDNKTAMVGLRLPDGCTFIKGNVTDEDYFSGVQPTKYANLTESAFVLSLLDNSTCPAKSGYQWYGYKGNRDMGNPDNWQLGQVILNCSTAGGYELDVAIGTFHWNITDYFCDNSFEVVTGSGTPASPTGIHTCDGLEFIDSNPTEHFKLNNDVDCAESSFDGVANDFYGSFDGQGHTISNMDMTNHFGMFEEVFGGNLSNIKFDNAIATGNIDVGVLVGRTRTLTRIENIEIANSNVYCTIANCGGAIGEALTGGYFYNITVHNSIINGSSNEDIGGIIGDCALALPNSLFYSYENEIYGVLNVGGVCGKTTNGGVYSEMKAIDLIIQNTGLATGGGCGWCENGLFSEIYIENIDIGCIANCGGVFGRFSNADFSNVIAHNITTNSTGYTGGIIGQIVNSGSMSNTLLTKYQATNTNENRTGILVGSIGVGTTIADVYYHDVNIDVPDVCGNDSFDFTYCNSTYIIPETEANLKLEATYTGWDFTTVFGIVDGTTYPYFLFNPQCPPDWSCTGYGSCNASDVAPCDTVVDGNACGQAYSGDYSEFSTQACDFCAYDLTLINATACDSVTDMLTRWYTDDNFGTCCNISGLGADCAFGNASSGAMNESCSVFAYDEGDIAEAVIDAIVKIIIVIGGLITVVVVVLVMINLGDTYLRGKGK